MVAYQWNWSLSSIGPAEQLEGGSLERSVNSFWIRLRAIFFIYLNWLAKSEFKAYQKSFYDTDQFWFEVLIIEF